MLRWGYAERYTLFLRILHEDILGDYVFIVSGVFFFCVGDVEMQFPSL